MTDSSFYLSVLILASTTFLFRFSFLSTWGLRLLKKRSSFFLTLLAPATFSAIIMNSILSKNVSNEMLFKKMAAAVLAFGVAYFTKNILITIVCGLTILYFIKDYSVF